MDVRELLAGTRLHHHEIQIGTLCSAVEDSQSDAELFLEVVHDFRHDIGFGGRGQTQDRRHRLLPYRFTNEAPNVAIVRAEVVSPLRETVGLIENSGTDLTLL